MIEIIVLCCWSGLFYAVGGLHGLYLAWTQELRMHAWARRVYELQVAIQDAEARGHARRVFK